MATVAITYTVKSFALVSSRVSPLMSAGRGTPPSVTYGMNILQNLPAERDWSVTLNDVRDIDPSTVARTVEYEHPEFMPGSMSARRRQLEFCRRRRTSFCGAWWGWGFHEDGCASGQAVAAAFATPLYSVHKMIQIVQIDPIFCPTGRSES